MFVVYDKRKGQYGMPVTVYSVRDDKNGYPHFLIYENDQWKYVSAKRFMGEIND